MMMKALNALTLVLLFAFSATIAHAQKPDAETGEYGIFQNQKEYYQFMGDVKSNPEMRGMVDVINDIVLQRPMGWTSKEYGGSGSTLGLLSDSKVRDELEMVDDQYEELQAMNADIQQRAAEQLRSLDFKNSDDLVSQIRKIRDQADKDLHSVLLPHQMDRLKQIRAQSRLRNRSFVEVITSEPLKTELDISDDQSEELREAEREIEEELQKEIAELREKARKRLLSKLKKSQREEVEEIFGNTFDFEDASRKPRQGKRRK